MASLKEVKRRIVSVEGTKKITVARQMISSALLHKTQDSLTKIQTYKESIDVLFCKLDVPNEIISRKTNANGLKKKTGVIIISSNSGMCGPFNMNIFKATAQLEEAYPDDTLIYYPVGKKIRETLLHKGISLGFEGNSNFDYLIDKPSYKKSAEAIKYFTGIFESGNVDRIIVVCTHFISIAKQVIKRIPLLPYKIESNSDIGLYIVEPSSKKVRAALLEKSLRAAFHSIIVDSLTSECAARTIAMQLASENANELLNELNITYNKLRQQNITAELLDIIGNSFA